MGLLTRIYYNTVFGALGGLLGWMLFSIFGDRTAGEQALDWQLVQDGALIGGSIGGTLGGFLGGSLFGLVYLVSLNRGGNPAFAGATGLVIMGACIGSLSALVQGVFQPASVKVLRGWQEGREYPLDKVDNLLGRDEHADIALFRDMRIEKHHAYIRQRQNLYILCNNQAPPEQTRVNDIPVLQQ